MQSRLRKSVGISEIPNLSFDRKRKVHATECDDTFVRAFSPVATLAQFLALVPVCGISKGTPESLQFKLWSLRTIYALCQIAYNFFVSGCMFKFIAGEGISAKNIGK